jgi:hypothetical protein
MFTKYPTKEEILKKEIVFRPEIIECVKNWKKEHYDGQWNSTIKRRKITKLIILVGKLAQIYKKPTYVLVDSSYGYIPFSRLILLDGYNPSIISTLHEFAHHLYNNSELQACRWSIQLFRKIFKNEFEKLEWKRHLLVKKK